MTPITAVQKLLLTKTGSQITAYREWLNLMVSDPTAAAMASNLSKSSSKFRSPADVKNQAVLMLAAFKELGI